MSEAKREREDRLLSALRERFGIEGAPASLKLLTSAKRARLVTREALEFLDVAAVAGVYVARETPFGIHLSIEGAALLGPLAEKNVVEIPEDLVDAWMSGSDLQVGGLPGVEPGPVILRCGEVYLGSGLYDGGRIRNMVSRARRSEPEQEFMDYALRREKEGAGEEA